MVPLQALALCVSLTGAGQTVLLDFFSDGCAPCRQMEPLIGQLEAAGYPVQKINMSRQPQAARQYGVTGVPCFILVSQGREVDRAVGAVGLQRLVQMFQKAGFRPDAGGQAHGARQDGRPARSASRSSAGQGRTPPLMPVRHRSAAGGGHRTKSSAPAFPANRTAASSEQSRRTATDRALAATVRIKIDEGGSHSYGTGTIVDAQSEEALVLTCGHIFRDSGGRGKIYVDLFSDAASQSAPAAHHTVPGQVIHYDLKRDVGLVAIRPGRSVTPMQVAGPGFRAHRGMRVFSVGCDRGAPPSVRESRVTHINKYLGPANIEVAGAPVDGRSGGGLFTNDGRLIGVCNAADPEDNEGLYAALETIHAELSAANLSFVYAARSENAVAAGNSPRSSAKDRLPEMPRRMEPPKADVAGWDSDSRGALGGRQSTTGPLAPPFSADDTEVIVILRSRSQPDQQGEVLFFDRPTPAVLDLIAQQRDSSGRPQATAPQKTAPVVVRGQDRHND